MSMLPSAPESGGSETIVEMGRLNGLSDGVYAIAITLLILDIRLPDTVPASELPAQLVALAPKLLIYLISFIVIGGAWGSHQRMLSQIKRGDGLLVWFNLLSLLFITLLPAAAALLGRYPSELVAILTFAADVVLIQLSELWLWRHASHYGLVNPALDPRVVDGIGRRFIISAGAFGLSLLLVLINPVLVYIAWIALFAFVFATDWLSWQQTLKTTQAAVPLDGAVQGEVLVNHGAGVLHVHGGGAKDTLVQGQFGGGFDLHANHEGDVMKVELSKSKQRGLMSWRYPWSWGPVNLLDWDLSLNPDIPMTLHIETSAGESKLDFTDTEVSDIRIKSQAGGVWAILPVRAGLTTLTLEGNAASFEIQVPAGVAAAIYAVPKISGVEVDLNRFKMIQDGREYRSPDYDTAANRVEIRSDIPLGSMKVT